MLEIPREEGKAKKSIPVEEARRLPDFFSTSPALAFRAAIIDAADDLNLHAANAVPKTLEERAAAACCSWSRTRRASSLPTIRSRCRRLAFPPWPEERIVSLLAVRMGTPPDEAARIARLAGGAPRARAGAGRGRRPEDRRPCRDGDAEPVEPRRGGADRRWPTVSAGPRAASGSAS